ncbi:MAG: dUTP diphosphatase [Solibacillus sp.]|uniref:dUTP diphosphatase n=1 Tax=Solibacillus sp. TaxID=1909654 RepID=UPI00331579B4
MKIAQLGNIVQWTCPKTNLSLKGTVLNVYDNSVVVDQCMNDNWKELGLEERTVVKHKNYTVVGASEKEYVAEDVKTYDIVPGYLENYHMLKEAGFIDGKIRKMWDDADKALKWHNARFYAWKQEHNLVNTYKSETPKGVDKPVFERASVEVQSEPKTQIEMLQEIIPDHPIFAKSVEREEPIVIQEQVKVSVSDESAVQELKRHIEMLMKELETAKMQLWSERTARLFEMQARLDTLICESNGIQIIEHNSEHLLATIVELAEVAQEEQSFKYWKKNKEVDRAKLLEELADVMHFIISRGVQNGIRRISTVETVAEYQFDTVAEQILYIIELLLSNREKESTTTHYPTLFKAFVNLSEMFGFTWDELSDEYLRKNTVNLARQNQNY